MAVFVLRRRENCSFAPLLRLCILLSPKKERKGLVKEITLGGGKVHLWSHEKTEMFILRILESDGESGVKWLFPRFHDNFDFFQNIFFFVGFR